MSYSIEPTDVWVAAIQNTPGEIHRKLESLRKAGANLEIVIARPDVRLPAAARSGAAARAKLLLVRRSSLAAGVLFVAPISGPKQTRAAINAGFAKASMPVLRVVADDHPGLAAEITGLIADAGINLHGYSAAALGDGCVTYLRFLTPPDAAKARRILARSLR